jgi:ribosomal protein L29
VNNKPAFSKKSAEEILERLEELKKKLINITSAEEFKEFMRPILKFRNTKKQQFSFGNTMLIWL